MVPSPCTKSSVMRPQDLRPFGIVYDCLNVRYRLFLNRYKESVNVKRIYVNWQQPINTADIAHNGV